MSSKYKIALIITGIFLILSMVIVTSYAWFNARVNGEYNASVITSGHMEVEYVDGPLIGTSTKMLPGNYVTKSFTVTNTGDVPTVYDIYLNNVINTFVNKDELVFELISENGLNLSQRQCPDVHTKIGQNIVLDVGETHNYELKISFLNKDYNQDANKGAMFSSVIELFEGLDVYHSSGDHYYVSELDGSFDDDCLTYNEFMTNNTQNYNYIKYHLDEYYYNTDGYYQIVERIIYDDLESCEAGLSFYVTAYNHECFEYGDKYSIKFIDKEISDSDDEIDNIFMTIDECKSVVAKNYNAAEYDEKNIINCEFTHVDNYKKVIRSDQSDVQSCIYESGRYYCNSQFGPWDNRSINSVQVSNFVNNFDDNFDCIDRNGDKYCLGKNDGNFLAYKRDGSVVQGTYYYPLIYFANIATSDQCYSDNRIYNYCHAYGSILNRKIYYIEDQYTNIYSYEECLAICGEDCNNGNAVCDNNIEASGNKIVTNNGLVFKRGFK